MSATTEVTPFPAGSIVVGVDGSPSGAEAVTWAAVQAEHEHRPLVLVHAYHLDNVYWLASAGIDDGVVVEELRAEGTRLLDAAKAAALEVSPELEVHEILYRADARVALLEAGVTASMVVVGSRGRGPVASLLLGSVGMAVVNHATCPVVVRRPEGDKPRRGVLVGSDLGDASRPTLEYAYALASSRRLPLTVLVFGDAGSWRTHDDPDAADREQRERLARDMTDLGQKFPDVRVSEQDVEEHEARALVSRGAEKEIVVVGGHHQRSVASALGRSLAAAVVEHAPTTVVVVPAPDAA